MDDRHSLQPDDRDYEGLNVVNLEEIRSRSSIEVIADFLHRRDRVDAVGCLGLIVLAIESYAIGNPVALCIVATLTVLLAIFVALIGRSHDNQNAASVKADAGASTTSSH